MTTIDTQAPGAMSVSASAARPLPGVAAWITTTDHKRIGRMYLGVGLLGLLGVAALGVLLGIDRISTSRNVVEANAVPQLFAAYRVGLVFIVLVPLVLGLATAIVPLQVGARSLAFPRLAAAGFWAWLVGAALVVGSIAANGGPGGGDRRMVGGFMAALIVLLLGLVAGSISVATTVLTTRAPGMNMRRVPLFSFSALVGAIGLIVALPVLIGTLLYTYLDYRYGGAGFGNSKQLFDHIGFGFTGPSLFVYAVPVFGIAAEVLAVATRKRMPLRGIVFTGFGLVGIAALGAVIQVPAGIRAGIRNVSFGTGASDIVPFAFFTLLPLLGGLIVLALGALALSSGKPRITAPVVFALLGAGMVFTGFLASAVSLVGDAHLGGTVFEEAMRIYIGYGTVLAVLGGITYWGPKLWGRTLPNLQVLPLALVGFLATVLAALPYIIAGFAKQPAESVSFDYAGPKQLWNVLATAGHGLMLLTVLAFVGIALKAFSGNGHHAGDDPWDAHTLEWATSSPAPFANFAEIHTVASAEPLLDLKQNADGSHV